MAGESNRERYAHAEADRTEAQGRANSASAQYDESRAQGEADVNDKRERNRRWSEVASSGGSIVGLETEAPGLLNQSETLLRGVNLGLAVLRLRAAERRLSQLRSEAHGDANELAGRHEILKTHAATTLKSLETFEREELGITDDALHGERS